MLYVAYGPFVIGVASSGFKGFFDLASKAGPMLAVYEPYSAIVLTTTGWVGKGISDFAGKTPAAQVSGPLLQGVLTGILTIRIGLAAQNECRLISMDTQSAREGMRLNHRFLQGILLATAVEGPLDRGASGLTRPAPGDTGGLQAAFEPSLPAMSSSPTMLLDESFRQGRMLDVDRLHARNEALPSSFAAASSDRTRMSTSSRATRSQRNFSLSKVLIRSESLVPFHTGRVMGLGNEIGAHGPKLVVGRNRPSWRDLVPV